MRVTFDQLAHPTAHHATVHTDVFRSGLDDRFVGGLVDFPGRTVQCIMVLSGNALRIKADSEEMIVGPAINWGPKSSDTRIKAKAGSNGIIMTLGDATLSNAIGHKPEAAALRLMSAREFTLGLTAKPNIAQTISTCFDAIFKELDAGQTGMETVIEAQIRIMLVSLWRAGVNEMIEDQSYKSANLTLERFRHLVEAHLRQRWPVHRFATELDVSPDRLHDICTRTLGKPPQRLIRDRLTFEAQALLQRSHQTLDQIADHLGFRSTSQFSAFFKAEVGVPPGSFRRASRQQGWEEKAAQVGSYADWP
ncbi:AraC family transcriptional activator of pobA [Planktotalea frisia]|jgi:AraC family transcriptional activator of pobA|uniref:HTH-type transcriptional activator RhaS n=1 Tax=Planktotalea frisia TaxID=696762 RepID=A0A1L9P2S6_9RHOB|nr:AraC family transcriptional regulator [Planktotalea frisia]OJI95723.1 HTH-type transcriptional activator RhaS [Planktotalea frisia]PZX20997.1 AraC family transcriptional activator of pobA [Planktotalea frisia]